MSNFDRDMDAIIFHYAGKGAALFGMLTCLMALITSKTGIFEWKYTLYLGAATVLCLLIRWKM